MKTVVLILILGAVGHFGIAFADDAPIDGGRSADGRLEVRFARTPNYDPYKDGSEYNFQLQSNEPRRVLLTINGCGFRNYNISKGLCNVIWSKSGRFVAICERDSRHTTQIYIVGVRDSEAWQLEFPDYVQNALGRVDATAVDFACITKLDHWDNDKLYIELNFTANGRKNYTCMVTLQCVLEDHSSPRIGPMTVAQPTELER
ncbi:hypothetical protein JIN85_19640 [Luteolibacter pohnpeiensis]|uniref:Uncharacterized protein n=1 Tax=Luteolibacter pohnpeiensis TaxID=454153 RepID=A0A934SB40_9BACT|nr:hypothetical protein [Luteolibacter pohnpeiensis]MBK1884639.1 hypothetical protein [Luteolibacter pohnpeiensis]